MPGILLIQGGRSDDGQFLKLQGGWGLRNFHDQGGDEDLWGLANFQDPGGWPMPDNDIFQGVQTPEDTMG